MNSGPSEKDKLMHIHIYQPSRHSQPTISQRRRGASMNQVLVDALVSGLPTRGQILTEAGEKP